jgi:hypothetical protein
MIKLYRGINYQTKDGIVENENENLKRPRSPKNTPKNPHLFADKWFKCKFGINARSETVFCTPSKEHALKYVESGGTLLEITLVEDDNSLIFSEDVNDFTDTIPAAFFTSDDEPYSEFADNLNSLNYKMVHNIYDLPKNFTGEIMLYSQKFRVENID